MTDEEFFTLIDLIGEEEACKELLNRTINKIKLENEIEKLLKTVL